MILKFLRKKSNYFTLALAFMLLIAAAFSNTNIKASTITFKPAPYEDTVNGRNSHVYLPATGHPTSAEQTAFINDIKNAAIAAKNNYGVPASAILGIAAVESGYGFTKIAHYANNLFAMKIWDYNPPNGWQLKGQPDEDGGTVPVIANYGTDRKVYNESNRRDNWYRAFSTRADAINYFAGTLMQNSRYKPHVDNYKYRIANGWTYANASKQFIYDIAAAGYNHNGGTFYRNKIGAVMDSLNLYQYDSAVASTPWVSPIDVSPVSPDGLYVSGTVTLSVTAGDASGITKIEFYSADGAYLLHTDYTAPYSFNWQTDPWVPNGEQKLKVIAYNTSGNTAGAYRTVYVSNNTPPVIGPIEVSPVHEDYYVWGDVTISADVSSTAGIDRVEFYSQNGAYLISTDYSAPYSINWATKPWVANGEQILKVIAYDVHNQSAESTRTIYVANNVPPVMSEINVSPVSADGYNVWGNVTISVSVTDPNGSSDIDYVEFYSSDGTYLISTDTTAPYSINWATDPWVPNGEQILRVKAFDKAGNFVEKTRAVNVDN